MSYILDALRKAERDRQLGRTPTLEDVTQAPASVGKPKPTARTLALIALVLGLAIVLVLVMGRSQDAALPDIPVANAPPASVPAAPIEAQAQAQAQEAQVEPIAPAPDPTMATESLDDLVEPVQDQPVTEEEIAESQADAAELDVAVADEPVEGATAAAIPQSEPVTGPRLLRDLPESYRSQFPALRVDVHVYNDEPAKRWVMVNGTKYQEASTMVEGPRISEISAEGMVLDYRGETVLIPLNR